MRQVEIPKARLLWSLFDNRVTLAYRYEYPRRFGDMRLVHLSLPHYRRFLDAHGVPRRHREFFLEKQA